MRLRNKKTGEIVEAESCSSYLGTIGLFFEKGRETDRAYDSLAELNEEWEDYDPKEPLIKDEEGREIMRLWAEKCGVKTVVLFVSEFRYGDKCICFGNDFGLEHLTRYTIDELCGEEEE